MVSRDSNQTIVKGRIFLIGGGEILKKQTLTIDQDIIQESGGKKHCRLLFFPTAAYDNDDYAKDFINYFHTLGCRDILAAKLSQEPIAIIKKKIAWATAIYLGGGITEILITEFEKIDLAAELKRYLSQGSVLAGISAGATAMGQIAIFSEIDQNLRLGLGLGLLPFVISLPHFQPKYKNKLTCIKEKFPTATVLGLPEKSAVYLWRRQAKYYNRIYKL